jgi:hypothetical protein
MITKLTDEQEIAISEYRDRYFRQAIDCHPANRVMAENAAMIIAEITDVKWDTIEWVNDPALCDCDNRLLEYSDLDRLYWEIFHSVGGDTMEMLDELLGNPLDDSLFGSAIFEKLSEQTIEAIRKSWWDSFLSSGWTAHYTYAVEVLGVKCEENGLDFLNACSEISRSCFALWIDKGKIVLCERPLSVEVVDGKMIGIKWR